MEDSNPQDSPFAAYKSRCWYGTNEDRSRQASASQASIPDKPTPPDDPGFRFATLKELEHANQALLSLGDEVARLAVKFCIADAASGETPGKDNRDWPVVVSDFSLLQESRGGSPGIVILVPPGMYRVPEKFFASGCTVIGLPTARNDFPTLMLEGETARIGHSGTSVKTTLRIHYAYNPTRFFGIRLDAPCPTVLEIEDGSGFFSERLMRCDCSAAVEVLDTCDDTFCFGRDWALAAYGPDYKVRSLGVKTLDSLHENILGAVDAVFRPLVAAGEKLDALLGTK
jgi:hypothetical protein